MTGDEQPAPRGPKGATEDQTVLGPLYEPHAGHATSGQRLSDPGDVGVPPTAPDVDFGPRKRLPHAARLVLWVQRRPRSAGRVRLWGERGDRAQRGAA